MKTKVTPGNCSIIGMGYFALRPYLWLGPLFASLLFFLILFMAFVFVAYMSWPDSNLAWVNYTWGLFKSLGYASLTLIVLWVFVFPILLNYAFENMIGKILRDKRIPIKREGPFQAMTASIQVIFRTFGYRLFWPLVTLFALFFFGPLAMILAQVGMGHIAIIDATDLCLTLQGMPAKKRVDAIKSRFFSILTAGVIAGILSIALSATIVGWLFWLPGIYTGCTLWVLTWPKE